MHKTATSHKQILWKQAKKNRSKNKNLTEFENFVYLKKVITMDLQSRKIEFMQEFLKVQSEEVISRLESILRKGKENDLKPMTIEEFNLRIDKSMNDSENGKLIESSELKAKMEQWS